MSPQAPTWHSSAYKTWNTNKKTKRAADKSCKANKTCSQTRQSNKNIWLLHYRFHDLRERQSPDETLEWKMRASKITTTEYVDERILVELLSKGRGQTAGNSVVFLKGLFTVRGERRQLGPAVDTAGWRWEPRQLGAGAHCESSSHTWRSAGVCAHISHTSTGNTEWRKSMFVSPKTAWCFSVVTGCWAGNGFLDFGW